MAGHYGHRNRGADRRLEHQDQAPVGVAKVRQVRSAKGRRPPCVAGSVSRCAPVNRDWHRFCYPRKMGVLRGQALRTRDALCPELSRGCAPKPPFGSFRAVPKGTRPSGRNLVVAKSALLRFRPKTAKTALRFLASPLPASPQAPYPSLPPLAKAHPFRCGSFPHKSTTFVGAPAIRFAGLRRGPQMPAGAETGISMASRRPCIRRKRSGPGGLTFFTGTPG